ncbi:GntR family transcriptional regulator [Arthrobacter sp. 35W]|uniref:GntR family transcriptional regulator n=1 Tax=Arthrobacter sp. 35W TaxID=1132441 RepID=UPI0003FA2808|nr:GntR family transcriptional regulator [Arthrobacter sp. 35W]
MSTLTTEQLILRSWRPDPASMVPVFEQLKLRITDLAASGKLVVGAKLPSVRALAAALGLAVNTVAKTYKELEVAGIVHTQGRAGTVVAASGDQLTAAVAEAATAFAAVVLQHGVPLSKALDMVRAAVARSGQR